MSEKIIRDLEDMKMPTWDTGSQHHATNKSWNRAIDGAISIIKGHELTKRVKLLESALRPFARWYSGSFSQNAREFLGDKLYPVEHGRYQPTARHLKTAYHLLRKAK